MQVFVGSVFKQRSCRVDVLVMHFDRVSLEVDYDRRTRPWTGRGGRLTFKAWENTEAGFRRQTGTTQFHLCHFAFPPQIKVNSKKETQKRHLHAKQMEGQADAPAGRDGHRNIGCRGEL